MDKACNRHAPPLSQVQNTRRRYLQHVLGIGALGSMDVVNLARRQLERRMFLV